MPAIVDRSDRLPTAGVTVRAVRPTDRQALAAMYAAATPESRRLRFFDQPSTAVLAAEVDRLCRPPDERHLALIAIEAGQVRGTASCERNSRLGDRAEFAVYVDQDERRRGIGTLLLKELAAQARLQGIDELAGAVLPDNTAMLGLSRKFGTGSWVGRGTGILGVGLPTGLTPSAPPRPPASRGPARVVVPTAVDEAGVSLEDPTTSIDAEALSSISASAGSS